MDPLRRVARGLGLLLLVIVVGTIGYLILGFGLVDALYQTVTTVSTVGFREVRPLSGHGKIFTIVLILAGVGTLFYTLTLVLEAFVEGHLRERLRRRHMERQLAELHNHVIVCGWGRVGRAVTLFLEREGKPVVIIDRDADRLVGAGHLTVQGDVSEDATLVHAGIERAAVLVAALDTDADNVYVTLSARSMRPNLIIVARARTESSEAKMTRAGANHVVNPQRIGGFRMGSFAMQPHVVDFLDVVMHDGRFEFRLGDSMVHEGSALVGCTMAGAAIRERTGALVLALRLPGGEFVTNPAPDTVLAAGNVMIAVGTADHLAALQALANG